jgi:pyridoxine 5-phosphate synthase
MPKLSVNVDHIATLRQARRAAEPDPVAAAVIAELAGALGITVHLRSDRRHIQDRDVEVLRKVCRTRLDLEMAATDAMIAFAIAHRPDLVTLVPERPEEVTTEGGLDVARSGDAVRRAIERLAGAGLTVSIFVDPDPAQVRASRAAGAGFIEINTGRYADAASDEIRTKELLAVANAARIGREEGLRLAAGHGLDYRNVAPVAALPDMEELNIGHSIIARAALAGLDSAVREMCALVSSGR